MLGRSVMVLVTALLMFPQIVETIYSPALTDISRYFSVSAAKATQTLSLYFIGFAVGVLFWGRFSDRYGRRPALLAGLTVYALGCMLALAVRDFTLLLAARMLSAFGAATGSVVSQTILRDRFNGRQLAALFSMAGLALAVSPAAGIYLGGAIVASWGMHGVLTALALLAAVLLLLCCWLLPETRPPQPVHTAFLPLLRRMATDKQLALAVLLVTAFNVSLFSYYSLAPFIFAQLRQGSVIFGYSGLALAVGSLAGALCNRWLLRKAIAEAAILLFACLIQLISSIALFCLRDTLLFLLPMIGITFAYAMAIPLVLGTALGAYGHCRGTAGAIFGLAYYVLIGLGLAAVGWGQSLAGALMACACVSGIAGVRYGCCLRNMRAD